MAAYHEPLWGQGHLDLWKSEFSLSLFGDAYAELIGRTLGRKKWPGTRHLCSFAACISSLAIDESRPRTFIKARASYHVDDVFISIQKLTRGLLKLQRDNGVEISTNINPLLAGLIQLWCKEETKWEDLLRITNLDEGDIVRASRRTVDLLRHIKNAPYLDPQIVKLAKDAFELMDKEPVKEIV